MAGHLSSQKPDRRQTPKGEKPYHVGHRGDERARGDGRVDVEMVERQGHQDARLRFKR